MNGQRGSPFRSQDMRAHRGVRGRGGPQQQHQTLPPRVIVAGLAALSLAAIAGYFFLMKLVDISRSEDCLMAGGRNCTHETPYKF